MSRILGFSAIIFVFALLGITVTSPVTAMPMPLVQTYEILPGQYVDVCGGVGGGCTIYSVTGSLSIEVDDNAGIATMTAFDVTWEGNSIPHPLLNGPTLIGLVGTLDNSTLSFAEPGFPGLAWTLGPLGTNPGDTLSWAGYIEDGCCDGFTYWFRETAYKGQPPSAPLSLVLVPEPGSLVLIGMGLVVLRGIASRAQSPAQPMAGRG